MGELGDTSPGEADMAFVRIGQFKAKKDQIEDLCRIYETDAIPEIKKAPGNVSAVLLRQHQEDDTFLAITLWKSREDAEAYDASGAAQRIVGKVRHTFAGPPTLTTYDAFGV
jgi:quinol monooxygenase YgiN